MATSKMYLTFDDLSCEDTTAVLARALELKRRNRAGKRSIELEGKVLTLLFTKPSTRTRVAFETGVYQLGGKAIYLTPDASQLSRGEPVRDTAKVLSSMCDVIAIRTAKHEFVREFAAASRVPVINALTDLEHPCQVLADLLTFMETKGGSYQSLRAAWVGDRTNVCNSWMQAAALLGFELKVATPGGKKSVPAPYRELANVTFTAEPAKAVAGANCVITDIWASMGESAATAKKKKAKLKPYTVTAGLMAKAQPNAVFMHCLPARRGEEVTAEVIDGPSSVVWDEAENRLHSQKALLEHLVG